MLRGNQSISCKACRRTFRSRQSCLQVHVRLYARWSLDVRYGHKQEATALLEEWVQNVGSKAGLTPQNTRLSTGSIGVPESRLEMEVTFDNLGQWEAFLAAVPYQEHKAWTQRIQSMVVDGTPVWQVHQQIPLLQLQGALAADASAYTLSSSSRSSPNAAMDGQLVIADKVDDEDLAAWNQLNSKASTSCQPMQQQQQPAAPQSQSQLQPQTGEAGNTQRVPLDWKGEPMKINPGDKMPIKFL
eukprot:GHRR01006585.1.p1 GENE.GHRR01006585.1~~GHRR01006585.1.p1  ORF type:complete len:243 (+),score=77.95 GHRR01006585.1:204-932(+)